jgi:signal peptidase II
MAERRPMLIRGIAVAVLVVVADQLSKLWVLDYFAAFDPPRRSDYVADFFNLALVWNRGISFGLFNGDSALNGLVFVALAAAVSIALLLWLRRAETWLLAAAIGLIVGGAVGNAIDRLTRGAVVDFLDFHLGQWHPFVFNLADAAISLGVGLLLVDGLLGRRRKIA